MRPLLVISFFLSVISVNAQKHAFPKAAEKHLPAEPMAKPTKLIEQGDSSHMQSNFYIKSDPRFDSFLKEYQAQKKVMGYRIQLFSGNKRGDAEKVRADFMAKYEKERPELIYQQPNFKIRVGNYRDRLQASKYLSLYKIDFPSAFMVKDAIHAPEEQAAKN